MRPILRRCLIPYAWAAVTYLAIMGRYTVTRDWSVFEIIPLFMPIWLLAALLSSEHDERYGFLRTLPVRDSDVARLKLTVILLSALVQVVLLSAVAVARRGDGAADDSTLVYLVFIAAFGALVTAAGQIAVWRYGMSVMKPVLVTAIVAGIALVIMHLASLKNVESWPALSQTWIVTWLGRAPWLSIPVIAAAALAGFQGLARLGVRVKAASEAHL